MIRRDRQGWRVLIVLSRLAIAGILSVSGPPGLTRLQTVSAQSDSPPSAHPPPPPVPPLRPAAQDLDPEAAAAGRVPGPGLEDSAATQPTPAGRLVPGVAAPLQIELPIPPSLLELTLQRNSLNQFLHRDRRHQLLLTRGDRALSDGDHNLALMNFQALIDVTTDAFFWPSDSLEPHGAQSVGQHRLQALPPNVREIYERRYGAEARALLNDAMHTGDDLLLLEVLQRFRFTEAGRETMIRELLLACDRGEVTRASQVALLLKNDPYHRGHLAPKVRQLVERSAEEAWQPNGTRNVSRRTSPPALRPQWSRSLITGITDLELADDPDQADGINRYVEDAYERWLLEHEERQLPVTTANLPIVVDKLLLVRDFAGVQALELQTGRLLWNYRCAGSLESAALESLQEEARGGGSPPLSFHAHFAGQGSRGRLTTDRQHVFLVDSLEHDDARQDTHPADQDGTPQQVSNRLVALTLTPAVESRQNSAPTTPRTAWVRGSRCPDESDSLAGHFFLGPPLCIEGRLYVLSESDRRLFCTALNSRTGETLWQQPIAIVEQPIDWDPVRHMLACTPLSVGSVIVCPTEVGVLVGVDSLTGDLHWIYDHIDEDQRHTAGRWSSSSQRCFGSTEIPSRMLDHDGHIYYLPFRSDFVHCIDAVTGQRHKRSERLDALGLSAIDNEKLILIGPREVMALSTETLSLQWKTTCPEPAGHGLVAGDDYLLPLRDGRCLTLSVTDGAIKGSRFGRLLHELAQPPPPESPSTELPEIQLVSHFETNRSAAMPTGRAGGNLLATDDVVVVTTPTTVAVFPQARSLLLSLTADNEALTPRQNLEAAMLHLLLGEQGEAGSRLRSMLQFPLSAHVQQSATRLLREILFQELAAATDPRPILDQLTAIPADDPDYLRLLVGRIDAELKIGDPRRLIHSIELLCQTHRQAFVNPESEADYRVQAAAYVADQLTRTRSNANDEMNKALEDYVSQTSADIASSGDIGDRECLLSLFRDWPQVANLRNDVAEAYLSAGHLQQAELLLLQNRLSSNRRAAAAARRLLTELYTREGFQREAAANLAELAIEYRQDPLGNGLTGKEYAEHFPHDNPIWQVLHRRRSEPLPAYQVRITEHICDDHCEDRGGCRAIGALNQHERIRRKFLVGDETTLAIIDRGIVPGDRNHSQLSLVNRETGALHAEFNFPAAYWQLAGGSELACGQLLPTCGRVAHGLSLLEQRPIWSTEDFDAGHIRDKVKLGPVGTDYCVLQSLRKLSVVHPGTGAIIWERGNLPPNVGLLTNESTGVMGDAETLTVFEADQRSYTVYRMHSGCEVRHGQLDIPPGDARRYRHALGAKLVHLVTKDSQEFLRIWDASDDRVLFETPLHERLFCPIADGLKYALVSAERRLLIVDIESGQIDLEIPLTEEQLQDVNDLAVATDRDHYFVNLVGCPTDTSSETIAATDEVEVPNMRVQGQLMTVSKTGRVLWQQSVVDAVLLTNTECAVPVLTLISRVRDSQSRQSSRLRVDVLDALTGATLARRDDLLRTRIVQSIYRHRPGQVALIGLNSQIEIDFGPGRSEFLIHAEVEESKDALVR